MRNVCYIRTIKFICVSKALMLHMITSMRQRLDLILLLILANIILTLANYASFVNFMPNYDSAYFLDQYLINHVTMF